MAFQAYLDAIEKQTKKSPELIHQDFKQAAIAKQAINATLFVNWLQQKYGLGRGYAMALWKYFVEKGWIEPSKTKLKKRTKAG